jgi:hypothetical protein
MNELMRRWYRRVDLNPDVTPLEPSPEWQRRFWKVAYRDARVYAHIACNACDELVSFRGFGVLKKIWARSGNVIGRVRTNDLRSFDNREIADRIPLTDYNPSRILALT